MPASQAVGIKPKKNGMKWQQYLAFLFALALVFVMPVVALLHFQEEIKRAAAYGYAGVFAVGILCGITIIPAPTQILIFTFGHVLAPWWLVGLVAGFGSAVGGITIYLTGAGVQNIVSKIQNSEWSFKTKFGITENKNKIEQSDFWQKGSAIYQKVANWVGGKGGSWTVFLTSAIVFSPFYPAGLAAGSLGMGLVKFFIISWAGKTVRYLYVAAAGYYGLEFILHFLR